LILQLFNIKFNFSPDKYILNDVSLNLENSKIYALLGNNGSGKTTLFNLINGFIKLKAGNIIFSGVNITNRHPYVINRLGIGRTFQDLRIITKLTVYENLILAMNYNNSDKLINAILPQYFHLKSNIKMKTIADEILERFFIDNVKNSLASDISYGQQKLLTLACCVSNGSNLLLLDEAVAGVQPEYRHKIGMILQQLKDEGKTIFLIEHNTDFISEIADEIYFLNEGKLFIFSDMSSLRNDKMVMEAYI